MMPRVVAIHSTAIVVGVIVGVVYAYTRKGKR